MHDLSTIYKKVKRIVKTLGKEYFVYDENSKFYPYQPILSDVEIISLAITAYSGPSDPTIPIWSDPLIPEH